VVVFLRRSLLRGRGEVVRARVVVGVNAGVVLALGLALLVFLTLSLLYGNGSWETFLIPAAAMIPLGAAGLWASRLGGVATSWSGTCISR
jgi:hypothetical protein